MESLKKGFDKVNFIIETKEFNVVDGQVNGKHVVKDIYRIRLNGKGELTAILIYLGITCICFMSFMWLLKEY